MEIIIASIVIGFLFCYLLRHTITSTQLEKAQDLVRECVRIKYKGC